MRKFVVNRMFQSFIIISLTVFIVFCILNIAPGDYVSSISTMYTTDAEKLNLRTQFDLNIPMEMRSMNWFVNWVQGDWGVMQIQGGTAILPELMRASRLTLAMMSLAMIIGLISAVLLSTLAIKYRNKWIADAVTFFTVAGNALPEFWVALMVSAILIKVSNGAFQIPGSRGLMSVRPQFSMVDTVELIRLMSIPIVLMSLRFCAIFTKHLRASLLEHINDDYIRTAHAKGLSWWRVHWSHLMPNAGLPILTMMGSMIPEIFTTCVVLETVLGIPGLGWLMYLGAFSRDGQLLVSLVSFVAILSVLISTLVDLLYLVVDPRIRYE